MSKQRFIKSEEAGGGFAMMFRWTENAWQDAGQFPFSGSEGVSFGAIIDEITNVYTAGAMAFTMFSNYDRSEAAWPLGAAAFSAVLKAVIEEERTGSRRSHSAERNGKLRYVWISIWYLMK